MMDSNPMQTAPAKIDERQELEIILHSETLRGSEVLRHLLKFLAEKTFSGEADSLKEYTVAIDALQKPSTYNPKHDSTVRIQVSRLRQKLADYYRTEGKSDPIIIDIPKGRFKLVFEPRATLEPEKPSPLAETTAARPALGNLNILLAVLLAAAVAWAIYLTVRLRHVQSTVSASSVGGSVWTPEIQELWHPFFDNSRPLILGIEDPLFMELQVGDGIYYRDRAVDEWGKLTDTRVTAGLRQLLHNPTVQPSHYYTTLGEVSAAFLVGKLAATRQQNVSLVRASELSWQQLADNNILIVGKQTFFDAQIRAMPLHPPFYPNGKGIENTNPNPGEPKAFLDQYSGAPAEEGEIYALITRLPGAADKGEFASFISNRAAGYVGALEWFTEPESAKILVEKLTNSKGKFPKHYQVVVKIKFKDEVPTEISYVLGRELD
jgi:hypothetical protein